MKRLFGLICLFAIFITAKAGVPTDDYMYATALQFDEDYDLYYFDVMLSGENKYVSYGLDIQLPTGMEVVKDEYGIFVERIDGIYPTSGRNKVITHEVSPNFPYEDDHSHLRVGCMSNPTLELTATEGSLFRVYVTIDYSANAWPLGAIKLYKMELGAMDETPYNPSDRETIVPLHSGETTLPLVISSAGWSTCILPFDAVIPDGVEAYSCDEFDSENLLLTKANSFEAFTPYILKGSYNGTVTGTVDADNYPETSVVTKGHLNGAIAQQQVSSGYVLQNLQSEGVKFYPMNGKVFSIPAGKCWVTLPDGVNAKGFNIISDEDADGIESVDAATTGTATYTLDGKMNKTPQVGQIYVKDGKKLLKVK